MTIKTLKKELRRMFLFFGLFIEILIKTFDEKIIENSLRIKFGHNPNPNLFFIKDSINNVT